MAPTSKSPTRGGVVYFLKQGHSARKIAAFYGCHVLNVEGFIARRGLQAECFGRTKVEVLAAELGVSRQAIYHRAAQGHFVLGHWGERRCADAANAAIIRQLFAGPKRHEYPDWLTLRQAAPLVGVSASYLYLLVDTQAEVLEGVRSVSALGISGKTHLLCPADMPLLSRRLKRRGLPERYQGRHTVPQLADLLGVHELRPLVWARKGCPYRADRRNRYWFDVAEVRAWLASGRIRPRDLAPLLARMDRLLSPVPLQEAS